MKQNFTSYDWQKKIIEHEGDVSIRGGRQSGKSTAVAQRIVHLANKYPGSRHLIIAATGRQSNYLLEKVRGIIGESKKFYRGRKTLGKLPLKNGTDIFRFEVGHTGIYVEGMSSVDFIYIDEAIFVGYKVFDSIIPMLAEPRKRGLGWITMLSATRGRPKGTFYDSFKSKKKNLLKIQIKSEDCPHISKEFLQEEKERLGERLFGVIYNGEFDEIGNKFWSPELIDKNVKIAFWDYKRDYKKENSHFLGIDPALKGKCDAGFVVGELTKTKLRIPYAELIRKSSLLDLERRTINLNDLFNFKKLYIDSGGLGQGLIDILEENFKHKLFPMNNKERGKDFKILKEDLYSNAEKMLEKEEVELVNDEKLIEGLKKVEWDEENQKIKGTDISEAFVRVCWAWREKPFKLKIRTF